MIRLHEDAGASVEALHSVLRDQGPTAQALARWKGPEGARFFVLPTRKEIAVDADGGINCGPARFDALEWSKAIVDQSCIGRAEDAGIRVRCNDRVAPSGCSATGGLAPLMALTVLVSLRRSFGRGVKKLREVNSPLRFAVVAALALGFEANAQCIGPTDCHCGDRPGWAAIIEFRGDAGGAIAVMHRKPGVAEPAWLAPEAAKAIAPEGTRAFVSEYGFPGYLIDAAGDLECPDFKVNAVDWARAVTDGTCHERAVAAGVQYPTQCRDVSRCSAAGGAWAAAAGAPTSPPACSPR